MGITNPGFQENLIKASVQIQRHVRSLFYPSFLRVPLLYIFLISVTVVYYCDSRKDLQQKKKPKLVKQYKTSYYKKVFEYNKLYIFDFFLTLIKDNKTFAF